MPKPLLLRFADRTVQGPHFHLTTVEWARNRLPGYHTHDYPEIFWVTRGACEHVINGASERLDTGTIRLMRASDAHQLLPWRGRGGFAFTNLSLSPAVFLRLRRAYPAETRTLYETQKQPIGCTLSRPDLALLEEEMHGLSSSDHTSFHLERRVLGIWERALHRLTGLPEASALPDWLRAALLEVQEPEVFSRGVTGLVAVSRRCHEHVARSCRRHLGKTPSQLVNEARLRHAARSLRMSTRSVTEIALDCGFENPAQFHRIFRAAHGTTPVRYRRE